MTAAWIYAAILMLLLAYGGVREATGGPYPQTYTVLLACLVPTLGNRFEQWWHQITRRTSYVYLNQGEVNALRRALFDPKANFCTPRDSDSKHMRRVSEWICGTSDAWDIKLDTADPQIVAWSQLVRELGDTRDPRVSGSPGIR